MKRDIEYLRARGIFDEGFLDYLRGFKFTGDVWAVPEGTPVFPREPVITVRAPAIQAQLLETFLLLTINHQSPHRHEGQPRSARGRRPDCARIWLPPAHRARTRQYSARARPT